jgi:hypothetical protein
VIASAPTDLEKTALEAEQQELPQWKQRLGEESFANLDAQTKPIPTTGKSASELKRNFVELASAVDR